MIATNIEGDSSSATASVGNRTGFHFLNRQAQQLAQPTLLVLYMAGRQVSFLARNLFMFCYPDSLS